jgi:hypothetical protein
METKLVLLSYTGNRISVHIDFTILENEILTAIPRANISIQNMALYWEIENNLTMAESEKWW